MGTKVAVLNEKTEQHEYHADFEQKVAVQFAETDATHVERLCLHVLTSDERKEIADGRRAAPGLAELKSLAAERHKPLPLTVHGSPALPTGEARLNGAPYSLVCSVDGTHEIHNGDYFTVEVDAPVCRRCRPFVVVGALP